MWPPEGPSPDLPITPIGVCGVRNLRFTLPVVVEVRPLASVTVSVMVLLAVPNV
jgi:hypothetical protein